MIHPINIPDDLLAANPKRPQLIDPKKKLKIKYNEAGRRFNKDTGEPLSPQTPVRLWNDFFIRSFVRRIACDGPDSEKTMNPSDYNADRESIDSLIDIVDLQIPNNETVRKFLEISIGEESTIQKNLIPDRVELVEPQSESDTEEGQFLTASTAFGQSAKLPLSRRVSAKIEPEIIKPILTPCCSCLSKDDAPLKEFARFDFSHSKFFSQVVNPHLHPNSALFSTEMDKPECEKSITLLPNRIGSRIWTNSEAKQKQKLAKSPSAPPTSICRPTELLFRVKSVSAKNQRVQIAIAIHNSACKSLDLEILEHLHEAENEKIGKKMHSADRCVQLNPKQETILNVSIEITESLQALFNHPEKYLVMTLLGRVL